MRTISELMNDRKVLWEQAKVFLERNCDPQTGLVPADAVAQYDRMVAKIQQYNAEISRLEEQMEIERQINGDAAKEPAETVTATNPGVEDNVSPLASGIYTKAFSDMLRGLGGSPEVKNVLSIGVDVEGGYTVPDSFNNKLIEKLNEHNVIRRIAKNIHTVSGTHKIPVAAGTAEADWIDETAPVPETSLMFDRRSLGAYKLGAILKVTSEFLHDTALDVEDYITDQFAIALGNKEEAAFINGTGVKQPTGLLHDTDGAGIGVTTENAGVVTFDDVMRLYYSLGSPYRKEAAFLCNEDLMMKLMLLKDGEGRYLFNPSLEIGKPDTLLGRPVRTSAFMPELAAGKKVLLFGDFSYYWIADRGTRSLRRLNELFAINEFIGFMTTERIDGKLILPDAMKALKVKE